MNDKTGGTSELNIPWIVSLREYTSQLNTNDGL